MSDRTRLIVVGTSNPIIQELMKKLGDSGFHIALTDSCEAISRDEIFRRIIALQEPGTLVGVLLVVNDDLFGDRRNLFIPICAHCKRIRDDLGHWLQPEVYFGSRFQVIFTHSICPSCADDLRIDMKRQVVNKDND